MINKRPKLIRYPKTMIFDRAIAHSDESMIWYVMTLRHLHVAPFKLYLRYRRELAFTEKVKLFDRLVDKSNRFA